MSIRPPSIPHWKSFILTFVIVFPTVQIINRVLLPSLEFWVGAWPPLARDLLSVGVMCMFLNQALPASQRLMARWLQSRDGRV